MRNVIVIVVIALCATYAEAGGYARQRAPVVVQQAPVVYAPPVIQQQRIFRAPVYQAPVIQQQQFFRQPVYAAPVIQQQDVYGCDVGVQQQLLRAPAYAGSAAGFQFQLDRRRGFLGRRDRLQFGFGF